MPRWPLPLLVLVLLPACASNGPRSIDELWRESQAESGPNVDHQHLEDLAARRERRLADLRARLADGSTPSPKDRVRIATMLLDSNRLEDLETAADLALSAAEAGQDEGFFTAARAIDRGLWLQGRPQRYGTVYVYDEPTKLWSLYVWDPATTDVEREAMGAPKLADALSYVDLLNHRDR